MANALTEHMQKLAIEAGFTPHPIHGGHVVRHSNGSWVDVTEPLTKFLELQAVNHAFTVPAGFALIPLAADKAALIGEFKFSIKESCSACYMHGAQSDCEVCAGEIEYDREVTVPWTTTKEIHKAIIATGPAADAIQKTVLDESELLETFRQIIAKQGLQCRDMTEELIEAAREFYNSTPLSIHEIAESGVASKPRMG
jgi:hypothetical protein